MAALTGNSVASSYQGLLKTSDNAVIGATEKNLTDGAGNASTLSVGTTSASFTGTLDLAGATITGLPVDPNTTYDLTSTQSGLDATITLTGSDLTEDTITLAAGTNITLTEAAGTITIDAAGGGGAAGLVTGGQTNSMKSAATLTTNPATTLNDGDIAIGENAIISTTVTNDYSSGGNVIIGKNASSAKLADASFQNTEGGVAIGFNATACEYWPASGGGGIAVGANATADVAGTVALGVSADAQGTKNIAIGYNAISSVGSGVALGTNTDAVGYAAIAIGQDARGSGGGFQASAIAIGTYSDATTNDAIAIGNLAQATLAGSVVIGHDITSTWAEAVHVNQLAVMNYANLNFADDTAAAAGGVVLGGIYHTSGALKIRIA